MQHLNAYLLTREFGKHIRQHFYRTLHVTFKNNGQFFDACSLKLLGKAFQGNARTLRKLSFAGLLLAVFGDTTGLVPIRYHYELIARLGQAFEAKYLYRRRGRRSLKGISA